tara:strand:+ start:365 stop:541 length:177 start_codon:yes stop_codon:yes gene_type:complete
MNTHSSNQNLNRSVFNDIDTNLLFGIQCSSANKTQQNYFENLKVQTQSAFMNKRFEVR